MLTELCLGGVPRGDPAATKCPPPKAQRPAGQGPRAPPPPARHIPSAPHPRPPPQRRGDLGSKVPRRGAGRGLSGPDGPWALLNPPASSRTPASSVRSRRRAGGAAQGGQGHLANSGPARHRGKLPPWRQEVAAGRWGVSPNSAPGKAGTGGTSPGWGFRTGPLGQLHGTSRPAEASREQRRQHLAGRAAPQRERASARPAGDGTWAGRWAGGAPFRAGQVGGTRAPLRAWPASLRPALPPRRRLSFASSLLAG